MKKNHKKKTQKRKKTKGGNVDDNRVLTYECINRLRSALTGYWGEEGNWQTPLNSVNIRYDSKVRGGDEGSKKRKRTEEPNTRTTRSKKPSQTLQQLIEKHPIIHFLVNTKNLSFHNALLLYSGEIKMKTPEYIHIMEILINMTEENTKQMALDGIIKTIIESSPYYQKMNILQPSMLQIFICHFFIDSPIFKEYFIKINKLQSPPDQKYSPKERWTDYLELFYKPPSNETLFLDYDKLGSNHEADLNERAEFIVSRCIQNGLKSIHTIDGHGRLIIRIVDLLIQNDSIDMNSFVIFVYDVSEDSNMWHHMTLPLGTTQSGESGNILNLLISQSENKEYLADKMFYLNFSGLTNQGKMVFEIIKKVDKTKNIQNIVVSFSCVRGALIPCNELYKQLITLTDKDGHSFNEITKRSKINDSMGDFLTMGVKTD